eukprot:121815-Pelagomonas_calceolata.AAC.4
MDNIFDGIQRPLRRIASESGDVFIPRGVSIAALDGSRSWDFDPTTFKARACVALCLRRRKEGSLAAPAYKGTLAVPASG